MKTTLLVVVVACFAVFTASGATPPPATFLLQGVEPTPAPDQSVTCSEGCYYDSWCTCRVWDCVEGYCECLAFLCCEKCSCGSISNQYCYII